MSRFSPSRRNQIMAWTAAALAWGTAFVAGKVEPARSSQATNEASIEPSSVRAPMPAAPINGLTILRYTPVERPQPEIQYVYVEVPTKAKTSPTETASGSSSSAGAAPPPPPANPPPPNPPSSGS